MDVTTLAYAGINLFGVFISAVSQVMLKKSAMGRHESTLSEYLNPLVVCAYAIFVVSTLLSVVSYRGIPLSMGPILEASGYVYVTIFGVAIFHEKVDGKRAVALAFIIAGIVIYALG